MIHLVNGLDQQPQFDFELAAELGPLLLAWGAAASAAAWPAPYFGIHTRTSDNNFSTFNGLAI